MAEPPAKAETGGGGEGRTPADEGRHGDHGVDLECVQKAEHGRGGQGNERAGHQKTPVGTTNKVWRAHRSSKSPRSGARTERHIMSPIRWTPARLDQLEHAARDGRRIALMRR